MAGIDLHLEVDSSAGVRAGLERALRDAVRSGRLAAGVRLPSSRSLAVDLGMARNTVADVYAQLVEEGYLTSGRGAGTRVSDHLGVSPSLAVTGPSPLPVHDLRPGRPDVSNFPTRSWLAAVRRVLDSIPAEALGYGDPRGPVRARTAIVEYLTRVRGVRASADQVVLCTGYRQAAALVLAALAARGAGTVALEVPGMPALADQARRSGLTPALAPVDADGVVVDSLPDLHADLAVLTPAHQFPTGATLPARRRHELLRWARRSGGLILEDDYDGEFRYDRQMTGSLQGLGPDVVVYAGSASKALAPGLRLAWLVVPADLLPAIVRQKELADRHGDSLTQLAAAVMIESGAYDRHTRAARSRYRRRRDQLAAGLASMPRPLTISGIAAGLHAVVPLPGDEAGIVAHLATKGIAVSGMSRHAFGQPLPPALLVGYATPAQHAWPAALLALTTSLSEALSS
jgi:GntR family transcriptional regulator/MocR family aminotransferase